VFIQARDKAVEKKEKRAFERDPRVFHSVFQMLRICLVNLFQVLEVCHCSSSSSVYEISLRKKPSIIA
jgi:hypothetical protein